MPTTQETPKARRAARPKPDEAQKRELLAEFKRYVNMTAAELEKWLRTDESKGVGQDSGDGTSVGAKSGAKIVKLLGKDAAALTAADLAHMRKVLGYISRHSAQGPAKSDKEHSPWRYSLMNWGHDPLKK